MATDDSSKDIHYAIGWSRSGLRVLGVFPDPEKPLDEFRKPNMRFLIFIGILFYFELLPQTVSLRESWGQLVAFTEQVLAINFGLAAAYKMFIIYYHREALRSLLTSVYADWMKPKSTEARERMLQTAGKLKDFSAMSCGAAVLACNMYGCLQVREMIQTWDKPKRYFIYSPFYPYNAHKSPTYEVTFFGQLIADIVCVVVHFSIDNFLSDLLRHFCGQLVNLRYSVNELVTDSCKNSEAFDAGLEGIIRRHNFLIGAVKEIDRCYSFTSFSQVATATLHISFLMFQICTTITDPNVESPYLKLFFLVFYDIIIMSLLFIYCYGGGLVQDESTAMAYGVYDCNWYDLLPRKTKSFMIISYRARIPLQLSIGKFGTFSLELFGSILKTSVGYLSVLLTVRDRNS